MVNTLSRWRVSNNVSYDETRCANVTVHGSQRTPRGVHRSYWEPFARDSRGSLNARSLAHGHACVHERPRACTMPLRARVTFPAMTAKLPAINNYANYAIKLFIQAVHRIDTRGSRLHKTLQTVALYSPLIIVLFLLWQIKRQRGWNL